MENPKKPSGPTWTGEQSGRINAIEQKYRDRMDLADAQGLKVDKEELIAQKHREIKTILTASQFKNYKNRD